MSESSSGNLQDTIQSRRGGSLVAWRSRGGEDRCFLTRQIWWELVIHALRAPGKRGLCPVAAIRPADIWDVIGEAMRYRCISESEHSGYRPLQPMSWT